MKDFKKRYKKFKNNNLPTPFWDEERQTFEYVNFKKCITNNKKEENKLQVNSNLTEALGNIAFTGFYYSFTSKYFIKLRENGKRITKTIVGHNHAHSFEEVVSNLYDSPESFSISEEEKELYSKQELDYLRRVQKYLLFIGMKDLEKRKNNKSRYINKNHTKYENAYIYSLEDKIINKIINDKINFMVTKWYPEYSGNNKFKPNEYQALIVDKEDNFKIFVEFIKKEVENYKNIKNLYKIENLKDEDKVIIIYFKILEKFE